MATYGTDKKSLQNTTGAIQNDSGSPLISTESFGSNAFIFGGITQGLIARGIENGDWGQIPFATGTASPISDDNDLPYWTLSGTAVPISVVEDVSAASGFILRASVPAGTSISSSISRFISIPGSRNRGFSFAPSIYGFNVAGTITATLQSFVSVSATWYKSDGTTTTGVAASGSARFAGSNTPFPGSLTATIGSATTIPSDAAFALVKIEVGTSATGQATATSIDLGEVSLVRGETTRLFTPSNATGTPGTISGTSGGGLTMGSGISVVGNITMNSGTAAGAAGNIIFSNAGTLGTVQMYSSGLLDYANLYAGDAGLRTDQRFVVGQRTSASTNLVDAPGVELDATTGIAFIDRSPITAATDASLFLSSGFLNVNLQMVRFLRKITVGGTVLTGTGHILVANNATTAPSFGAGSDYRLKESIRTANVEVDFLKKIDDLRPVLYTEKATGDELLGFIAHEVEAVVPEAVEGSKDAVDENGDPVFQSLYAAKFIPYLIGAVQELSAKVADLESRLVELENK
jgi:hypothetical protein